MGAGDHIDGVGKHGRPCTDRETAHARREPQHERSKHRAADADDQALSELARLNRRAQQQRPRQQGERSSQDHQRDPEALAPERDRRDRGEDDPDQHADADHRRPPGAHLRHAALQILDVRDVDRAVPPDRLPGHVAWLGDAEPRKNRRCEIGRQNEAPHPGRIGRERAVEPAAGDPERERAVGSGRRPLDRDDEIVAVRVTGKPADGGEIRGLDADYRAVSMTARTSKRPMLIDQHQGRAARTRAGAHGHMRLLQGRTEQPGHDVRGDGVGPLANPPPLGRRHLRGPTVSRGHIERR